MKRQPHPLFTLSVIALLTVGLFTTDPLGLYTNVWGGDTKATQSFPRDTPVILTVPLEKDTNTETQRVEHRVKWTVDKPSNFQVRFHTDDLSTAYCWASPGQYTLSCEIRTITVNWTAKTWTEALTTEVFPILITGGSPIPDPIPDPTPIPPDTGASINPAGNVALFLIEESDFSYPESVRRIFNSTKITTYLNSVCVKEPGGFVGFRRWDDDFADEQIAGQSKFWTDAYHKANEAATAAAKGTGQDKILPWLLISTKTYSVEVDISKMNEDEVLALLKKHFDPR